MFLICHIHIDLINFPQQLTLLDLIILKFSLWEKYPCIKYPVLKISMKKVCLSTISGKKYRILAIWFFKKVFKHTHTLTVISVALANINCLSINSFLWMPSSWILQYSQSQNIWSDSMPKNFDGAESKWVFNTTIISFSVFWIGTTVECKFISNVYIAGLTVMRKITFCRSSFWLC